MTHAHHHHHGHHHHHHDGDSHRSDAQSGSGGWFSRYGRFVVAFFVVLAAVISASMVLVGPGSAIVVTRFGAPVNVLTQPGLAWKIPAPIESTVDVDLRLRTTSSGLQDVGTRDGLRILVQAYVAWQVPPDADHIRRFLRAVRNQPDVAAQQLRSFIGSSLEIAAASFDLSNLVNTDPAKVQLAQFESRLRERLDEQALKVYGITVRQVGIDSRSGFEIGLELTVKAARLGLPVAEIPTIWLDRSLGESRFDVVHWLPAYLHWYRFAFGRRLAAEQIRAHGQRIRKEEDQ